ncbi:hypothetical protein BGW36DRAFT_15113 [Talaromyces proteolyticus]|uniref:F-box domain-containing protein n=1 Tax=Talaromyces proteolyticus TaxID=1131652 RepID=A0AAD4L445_9EURO|nr:uncharacterized protein BGW36DRAFT_15113 [Talaromyces proteolyticus]KAH8705548.1 hypothetical protein BGW36DRAFT_15113 [Talaromyces proteolyticus]
MDDIGTRNELQQLPAGPTASLQSNVDTQQQSPLFKILPAEIRSLIFTYALTDYEDISAPFDRDTYWHRPGYGALRRTTTELLRTCKRIFQETWFLPFALAEYTFYLTKGTRAPAKHTTIAQMKRHLQHLRKFARSHDGKDLPSIHHIRVFAQLWALEDPRRLQNVLSLDGFCPLNVTITVRYTDFWHWEQNRPLHIDARWVNEVPFPNSVRVIKMEFEMVDRRKKEIDYISDKAAETWFFRRVDGLVLRARKQNISTSGWTGSSSWDGSRWVRDEARPNEIDYYIKTVVWTVDPEFDPFTDGYYCRNLDIPSNFVQEPVQLVDGMASISTGRG